MRSERKISAAITALGGYLPDHILTNRDLESLVDTSDEWIKTRTGIEERRILKDPAKATSDLSIEAINVILKKKNLDPAEIECIICCTMTPDMQLTVTAAYIATQIGAVNAWGYDFTAACCGFIYGLTTAAAYIESGRYKKILVIGVDNMTRFVDYKDRGTCIIFGDGAGAALVEPNYEGLGLIDSYFRTDGSGRRLMHQKAGGSLRPASHETVDAREHYAYMDGKGVFKYAVNSMADSILKVMERNNLKKEHIAWVVPHQANKRIIEAVAEQADLPLEKMMINIQRYGNTIAGTIPICLWEWEPRLKKGDNIILVAFGGGFTWGASSLKWAYDGSKFLNGKHV